MDYLKSNYVYWKSLAPDSPSNSASEEEVRILFLFCLVLPMFQVSMFHAVMWESLVMLGYAI